MAAELARDPVELEFSGRDADAAVPGMHAHLEGSPACAEDHDSLHALLESEHDPPRPDGIDASNALGLTDPGA